MKLKYSNSGDVTARTEGEGDDRPVGTEATSAATRSSARIHIGAACWTSASLHPSDQFF
jgi:hypothetical protein